MTLGVSLVLVIGSLMVALTVRSAHDAATVNLGTATSFAVLAGSAITNVPDSDITGDVGLHPAAATFIELTCDEVDGTIYARDSTGPVCFAVDDDLLTTAKNNLTTAYTDAAGRDEDATLDTELGGLTLVGGVYKAADGEFGITTGAGALTLDGANNPDTVWIFQMASTLITAANSSVNLIRGADACNVFWQVGTSATLGTDSNLVGTVMADQSIAVQTGATVNGRVLARIAAVTLDQATINVSICQPAEEEPTPTPTNGPTATPTNGPTASPTNGPTATPTNGPTASPTNGPTATPGDGPTATPSNGPTATPGDGPTATPTNGPTATPTLAPAGELPDTATALPPSAPNGPGLAMLLLLAATLAAAIVLLIRPPFDPRARAPARARRR